MQSSSTLHRRQTSLDHAVHEYIYRDPIDPHVRYLYRPRTITVLVLILAVFLWIALYGSEGQSLTHNSLRYLVPRPAAHDDDLRLVGLEWPSWCTSSMG